jgi:hypothetical protein
MVHVLLLRRDALASARVARRPHATRRVMRSCCISEVRSRRDRVYLRGKVGSKVAGAEISISSRQIGSAQFTLPAATLPIEKNRLSVRGWR